MRQKYVFISIALLISLFIYLFYRTDRTVVNELLIRIISFDTYTVLKANIDSALPLSKIIIYSLPEGLWVFCITLTSRPYFMEMNGRRIDCVFIPIIFAVGLEILQLFHITNGRFDFMDIGVSLLFWIIAGFLLNDKATKQNILTQLNPKTIFCLATYGIVYLAHVHIVR